MLDPQHKNRLPENKPVVAQIFCHLSVTLRLDALLNCIIRWSVLLQLFLTELANS
ncbi:uncharacterized protein EbC_40460 [Erwinia billingiae Eb661]|uniref:Uncharacterized protein n=1 Tax=Erwinia billingiae (strain Eb661) TaxID=634500 RepID=D8MXM0_ERWBE|nr:uncharacterized protein EbC_40460 [Erwinia billingiae Eb661]